MSMNETKGYMCSKDSDAGMRQPRITFGTGKKKRDVRCVVQDQKIWSI